MLIGTSLSACVQDIIEGKVDIDAVDVIFTGTGAESEGRWAKLIQSYQKTWWQADPEMAEEVVLQLREAGKIIQPRLIGLSIQHGRGWIEGDDNLRFRYIPSYLQSSESSDASIA